MVNCEHRFHTACVSTRRGAQSAVFDMAYGRVIDRRNRCPTCRELDAGTRPAQARPGPPGLTPMDEDTEGRSLSEEPQYQPTGEEPQDHPGRDSQDEETGPGPETGRARRGPDGPFAAPGEPMSAPTRETRLQEGALVSFDRWMTILARYPPPPREQNAGPPSFLSIS